MIRKLLWLIFSANLVLLITLIYLWIMSFDSSLKSSLWLTICLTIWIIVNGISILASFHYFTLGFLLSLFSTLVIWRATWVNNIYFLAVIATLCFFLLCFILTLAIYTNQRNIKLDNKFSDISLAEWCQVLIRLVIGFDFIPHFTEKLFAGRNPHQADFIAFTHLHVIFPHYLVWIAGLCELGAAVGIGLGFLTRLAAPCTALYLLICLFSGQHDMHGFIWCNPGGGWEFPFFWMILVLIAGLLGPIKFSIDSILRKHFSLPRWLLTIMG